MKLPEQFSLYIPSKEVFEAVQKVIYQSKQYINQKWMNNFWDPSRPNIIKEWNNHLYFIENAVYRSVSDIDIESQYKKISLEEFFEHFSKKSIKIKLCNEITVEITEDMVEVWENGERSEAWDFPAGYLNDLIRAKNKVLDNNEGRPWLKESFCVRCPIEEITRLVQEKAIENGFRWFIAGQKMIDIKCRDELVIIFKHGVMTHCEISASWKQDFCYRQRER